VNFYSIKFWRNCFENGCLEVFQVIFRLTGSLWRRQSQQSFNTLTPFNLLKNHSDNTPAMATVGFYCCCCCCCCCCYYLTTYYLTTLWGSSNNNNNKSLELPLLVYCLSDFYVYVTQQNAPHRDKIPLISFLAHYMFRPLQAILRWDMQLVITSVFEGLF
jgi:hypothetical protein